MTPRDEILEIAGVSTIWGRICSRNYNEFASGSEALHFQATAGARNPVEGEELLPRISTCRGLPEVATRYSKRNALEKSVHFRLAWPVRGALPATHLPAPAGLVRRVD